MNIRHLPRWRCSTDGGAERTKVYQRVDGLVNFLLIRRKNIAKLSFPLAILCNLGQVSIYVGETPVSKGTHNSMRGWLQPVPVYSDLRAIFGTSR